VFEKKNSVCEPETRKETDKLVKQVKDDMDRVKTVKRERSAIK